MKEVLFLGFFNFLYLNWYFLGVDISNGHSDMDKTRVPFMMLLGSFSKFPACILALLCIGAPGGC